MPTGLQIHNDHGSVLIDNRGANMAFHKTVAAANFSNPGTLYDGTLVAFRPTGFATKFYPSTMDGTAYVFAPTNSLAHLRPSSGVGLEVFSEAGECMYSSLLKPMRVVDFVHHSWGGLNTQTVRTYTAGRTYAVVPLAESMMSHAYTTPGGSSHETMNWIDWYLVGYKVDGHVVTFRSSLIPVDAYMSEDYDGWWEPPLVNEGTWGDSAPRLTALVVDVTNF